MNEIACILLSGLPPTPEELTRCQNIVNSYLEKCFFRRHDHFPQIGKGYMDTNEIGDWIIFPYLNEDSLQTESVQQLTFGVLLGMGFNVIQG